MWMCAFPGIRLRLPVAQKAGQPWHSLTLRRFVIDPDKNDPPPKKEPKKKKKS